MAIKKIHGIGLFFMTVKVTNHTVHSMKHPYHSFTLLLESMKVHNEISIFSSSVQKG